MLATRSVQKISQMNLAARQQIVRPASERVPTSLRVGLTTLLLRRLRSRPEVYCLRGYLCGSILVSDLHHALNLDTVGPRCLLFHFTTLIPHASTFSSSLSLSFFQICSDLLFHTFFCCRLLRGIHN